MPQRESLFLLPEMVDVLLERGPFPQTGSPDWEKFYKIEMDVINTSGTIVRATVYQP